MAKSMKRRETILKTKLGEKIHASGGIVTVTTIADVVFDKFSFNPHEVAQEIFTALEESNICEETLATLTKHGFKRLIPRTK